MAKFAAKKHQKLEAIRKLKKIGNKVWIKNLGKRGTTRIAGQTRLLNFLDLGTKIEMIKKDSSC